MKPRTTKLVIMGIIGILFTCTGFVLFFSLPHVFHKILDSELPLTPNSRIYEMWRDTSDIPMTMEFYFFNWTNPEELEIPGKKPNLIELGPYSFDERIEKVNIVFHPENSTVSYDQRKFWYFNQEKSNGSLSDNIVQLNIVAISASHKTRYRNSDTQNMLSLMLSSTSSVHTIKTVDELLFSGYSDHLINAAKVASTYMGEDVPPFDKFGWFYQRNGSTYFDGHFNMATGADSLSNLGMIKSWNYKDTTSFYKSPCNIVEGSAGEFWPPNRDHGDITIWSADLCRPMVYEYTGPVMHHNIMGYRYAIGEKTLGNNTKRHYPHEQAKYFEVTTTTEDFFEAKYSSSTESSEEVEDPDTINIGNCYCNGECSPMGLVNITACRYGAPGFISLPHFHKADPMLRDQVIGMNPNERDHSFYIVLEPHTGVPLDVAARFQINILLQPSNIAIFKNVPKIYFPVFWFNLKGGTTEDLAWGLRQLLIIPSTRLYGSIFFCILGALILVTVAILSYIQKGPKKLILARQKVGASTGKKAEAVYMDTTITDDEHDRNDLQLNMQMKNL